jgi:hypothetical protein
MFTKTRVGCVMWAGLMLGLLSQRSWANDKNFKAAAGQSRCKSLTTRDGIEECQKVQGAKNTACNRPSTCELSKQEDWAKEYDELYRWWDNEGNKLPDNPFKSDKQRQMRDLVDKLVGRTPRPRVSRSRTSASRRAMSCSSGSRTYATFALCIGSSFLRPSGRRSPLATVVDEAAATTPAP